MKPSEFLAALWGAEPAGLIQLWSLAQRYSWYLPAPADADDLAAANPADLYTCVALAHKDHGRHHRATAEQALAISGLWVDIDVDGGPDGKTGCSPDLAAALKLTTAIVEPTLLVHSGYGVHAWWLFDRPWRFRGYADQYAAAHAVRQWQHLLRQHAGHRLDATHDLARLLRLPGTVNAKGGDVAPVEGLEGEGPRYTVDRLLELAAEAGPLPAETRRLASVVVGEQIRDDKLEELLRGPEFARTWRHERTDHPDWSMSEYDLALCSLARKAGWTDQQLAGLIGRHRAEHGDSKGDRDDYVARTIARAGDPPPQREPQADLLTRATFSASEWGEHILEMLDREDEGAIPMPFRYLTEALDGGLRPGEVCLVAGYTSHGKSVIVDQIADTAADSGRRVHLYMTEMTAYSRGLRLLARRSHVPFAKLKRRKLDAAQRRKVVDELGRLPYGCSIVSDWTVEQVVAHIREHRWDLAVVDLVHGFHYADERDLSKTSSALVRAAKGSSVDHRGTAIVAAAHLNDGQMRDSRSPQRPKPGLHSIKGSSSLKQDADVVMFVWQEDDEDGRPTGDGAVWFGKSRQGELAAVSVTLDTGRMEFLEVADRGFAAESGTVAVA